MPEMTLSDCAAKLWDAGCRVEWEEAWKTPIKYRLVPSDLPKAKYQWRVDHKFVTIDPTSWLFHEYRTTHEAAVLLLWQAWTECLQNGVLFHFDGPASCWIEGDSDRTYDSKHAAIVAAYLRMKGVAQ